ncbi:MAG: hypothetical protein OXE46_07445 [Chloroflexi bacterium]|nr:hypothetical protein [Chloroflexota bacterium]
MQEDLRRELHQQRQIATKVFGKKECLHPAAPKFCNGNIVRAHTVQRRGALSLIAEDGHVLTLELNPDMANGRLIEAQRIGISRASTFTGFCSTHDKQLFAPIEDHPLQLIRRHAFLLAYRSLSRERFGKSRLTELIPASEAAGITSAEFTDEMEHELDPVKNDLAIFDEMGNAILRNNYSGTRFYAIEFNSVPEIMCSGATYVIYDFDGNMIRNSMREEPFDIITLTLLPFGNGHGVAVFAWYGRSNVNRKFIKSLHKVPKRDIPNILVRFLFYNFENMFFSPTWWDNLPETAKGNLLNLFEYRAFHNTEPEPFYDLRPDGNSYVNWNVVGKRKNNLGL